MNDEDTQDTQEWIAEEDTKTKKVSFPPKKSPLQGKPLEERISFLENEVIQLWAHLSEIEEDFQN